MASPQHHRGCKVLHNVITVLLIFRRFPTRTRDFLPWWLSDAPDPVSTHVPPCPLRCPARGRWQNNWTKLWIYLQSFWCVSFPDMCIATAISLLMILICAMATYGAYKVIHYIRWRQKSSELYNSVEKKKRKLLSNNFLLSYIVENWEREREKKSQRSSRTNCLAQWYPWAPCCGQENCPALLTVCSFSCKLWAKQIQRTESCTYQN